MTTTPTDLRDGLSGTEAASRLLRFGPNRLRETRSRGLVQIAAETLREPMFLLLLAAAGLYLVIGDLGEGPRRRTPGTSCAP